MNDSIVVELKTVDKFEPIHEAIILTYMNILEVPQGLLINFKSTNIPKSTKPFVNEYFNMLKDE